MLDLPALHRKVMRKENQTDFEFAQKLTAGDSDAWRQLYQKHERKIYSVCKRMMRTDDLAEEMTQQTMIQIFRKIGSYQGDAALSTWIHRIAVNQCLMYFRAAKPERENDIAEAAGAHGPRDSVEIRIDLNRLLPDLPDGYRKVLLLHDFFGFEHKEIAAFLNVSEGTTKSQLHKARHKARKLYNKRENPRALAQI
jgi:RNA polymerase sigma-70 factor, ECF subfamily